MNSVPAAQRAASLPMYLSRPDALHALWGFLRQQLLAAGLQRLPMELQWPGDLHHHWLDPDLLLSQACGYPLVTFLSGRVRVIGSFRYSAEGCDEHLCRSALIVRGNDPATSLTDLRGRIIAFNSTDSQSGYNALRALVAPLAHGERFFSQAFETGSHRASLELVAEGRSDLAALDCVTLAGLRLSQPALCQHIRVLGWSDPYPGLPLITAGDTDDETLRLLRQALMQAVQAPELAEPLKALFIQEFVPLHVDDYAVCSTMRDRALALGCTAL